MPAPIPPPPVPPPDAGAAEASAWDELRARMGAVEHLEGVMGLLEWDQQVFMPPDAASARGDQIALLAGLVHERLVHPALGEAVAALEGSADPTRRAAARVVGRRHRQAARVPGALVQAQSRARALGHQAWMEARAARSFAPFAPALAELVRLARAHAACLGDPDRPYDALLDQHDPGATAAALRPMFARLADGLAPLVARARRPAAAPLRVPRAALLRVSDRVIRAMGYDLQRGRLDESQHPFTVGMHPQDVRITTHVYEDDVLSTLGGTIHEAGHGLYEQGLPEALRGTGLCAAASTGLHESQSRFWENHIGRSDAFLEWLAGALREEAGVEVDAAQLIAGARSVTPSLIRVKADEATYNLHIIARFELELGLIGGDLPVDELPAAWDAAYGRLLGVAAPDPVDGVLQDIHWSAGYFGYFPSYTLGNLYAASLDAGMRAELPGIDAAVRGGELGAVLGWLRSRVHARGATADADSVVRAAVGPRDPVEDLLQHLRGRFAPAP
jgi:carboxypeptidase Taq